MTNASGRKHDKFIILQFAYCSSVKDLWGWRVRIQDHEKSLSGVCASDITQLFSTVVCASDITQSLFPGVCASDITQLFFYGGLCIQYDAYSNTLFFMPALHAHWRWSFAKIKHRKLLVQRKLFASSRTSVGRARSDPQECKTPPTHTTKCHKLLLE